MDISEFKNKKVWAVVGNIHNKDKFAYKIYKFLKDKGYTVYPVDPTGKNVDGEKTYTSLLELPEVPESVNMVINPVKGIEYLNQIHQLDIKYLWFQPGAESMELVERALANNINVVYNKCVLIEF
ncbi:CoA-binding protein [Caloramator sp. E03]|uniref:CoA-binding protein n=1 Tax=Caloramator sp. E03 TaxID=2576307 RepID=UPI0011102BF8|nr:CoA-binding protein [Caloramator sp. E03]QCX32810.1 CoA-binding protein [Caloramator sp. E03]